MQDKKRSIHIIKNILYYGITLFLLLVISISLFIPNGLVKVFGVGWYRVVSESMEPLIMTGDYIIVVKDTNVETFEDGDIIIFETHFYNRNVGTYVRNVVTHHFYGLDEAGYVLTYPHSQADKNPSMRTLDEWRSSSTTVYKLKQSDIIGRHSQTIKMSYFTAFITSPYGIAVIIINIGLVIGLIVLYQYDKQKRIDKSNLSKIDIADIEVVVDTKIEDSKESDDTDVANLDK